RQMGRIAEAGGAEVELYRIVTGDGPELLHVSRRKRPMPRQHFRAVENLGDWVEALGGIVVLVPGHRRDDSQCADIAEQKRVAVRLGIRDRLGPDDAAAAGAVFYD